MISHRRLRRFLFLALSLFGAGGLRAEDAAAKDPVVALPAYTVTDARDLPPPEAWRHAEIPGFEILSNASDRETKRLIADFQLFNQAIGVVWPALIGRSPTPVSLILCGRGGKFDAFVPKTADAGPSQGMASLFLRDAEHSAIVVNLQAREIGLAGLDSAFNPSGVENNGNIEVDAYKQLYREYVHSLLARTTPRMAAWLEEGLAQLLMGMKVSPTLIEFAKLDDPNTVSISQANAAIINSLGGSDDASAQLTAAAEDRDFNAALQRTRLMSFPELFAVKHDDPVARNSIGSKWAKQSTAFVHMCLYQTGQKYQKGFVTFITRSSREPVTEALFKECFGIGYNAMLLELRGYLDFTNYKSLGWSSKKGEGLTESGPLVLRDATESEVGRIKGEALLLAGLNDAARTALITPYTRGERDPRLLAALGLYERGANNPDRAKKFLEAATAAKVVRPLAYLELARLRFQAAQAAAGGPEAQFTAAQTADIIAPLLVARLQPPPMPETYELIGDTYARSVDNPKPDIMGMLVEGVNLNPKRVGLVYRTAVLFIKIGDFKDAATLIDHGLRYAPPGVPQTRFAELKASLPPGTVGDAPEPKAKPAAPAKS